MFYSVRILLIFAKSKFTFGSRWKFSEGIDCWDATLRNPKLNFNLCADFPANIAVVLCYFRRATPLE